MILKMENYKYPTREEWLEVSRTFPEIGRFGFPHINEVIFLLERKKTIPEVHLLQNLFQWDSNLSEKVWNLRQSYVNTIVNYNRGIDFKNRHQKNECEVINLYQFKFYCETSFYYLISVRDLIFQIINLAFELKLPEGEVKMSELLKKINDKELMEIVEKAADDLKEANKIRNFMAHKFSKLKADNRSKVSNDGRTYSAFRNNIIYYDKQIETLEDSLISLHCFHKSVKARLSEKFSLIIENN